MKEGVAFGKEARRDETRGFGKARSVWSRPSVDELARWLARAGKGGPTDGRPGEGVFPPRTREGGSWLALAGGLDRTLPEGWKEGGRTGSIETGDGLRARRDDDGGSGWPRPREGGREKEEGVSVSEHVLARAQASQPEGGRTLKDSSQPWMVVRTGYDLKPSRMTSWIRIPGGRGGGGGRS